MINPVVAHVTEHSKRTGTERMILILIAMHADADTGIAFPGNRRLAELANTTERTVIRCIKNMVAAGELQIVSGGNGRGHLRRLRVTGYEKGDH